MDFLDKPFDHSHCVGPLSGWINGLFHHDGGDVTKLTGCQVLTLFVWNLEFSMVQNLLQRRTLKDGWLCGRVLQRHPHHGLDHLKGKAQDKPGKAWILVNRIQSTNAHCAKQYPWNQILYLCFFEKTFHMSAALPSSMESYKLLYSSWGRGGRYEVVSSWAC